MTKVISVCIGQIGDDKKYFQYLDCLLLFVASTYNILEGWTFCIQLSKGTESERYAKILQHAPFYCKVKLVDKRQGWQYAILRYDVVYQFPKENINTWVALDVHYDGLYKYYKETKTQEKERKELANSFLKQLNTFDESNNSYGVNKYTLEPRLRPVRGGLFASKHDLHKLIELFLRIKNTLNANEDREFELKILKQIQLMNKRNKNTDKPEGYGFDEVFLSVVLLKAEENNEHIDSFKVRHFQNRAIDNIKLNKKVVKSIKNNTDVATIVEKLDLKFNDRPPPTI